MPSAVWAYLVWGTTWIALTGTAAPSCPDWARRHPVRRRPFERGILAQDAGVQFAQLRAGLDPKLVDQGVTQLAVGAQRVGLSAGPVQRQHPLGPEPLAERMGRGQALELRDELTVPAAGQQRLAARFERGQPLLVQPACLRPQRRRGVQVGQRGPAPQAQGLIQRLRCGGGVARRQGHVPRGGEPLEPPASASPGVTRSR